MEWREELIKTAGQLSRRGHGILAADESVGTIGKRLESKGLTNDFETRRQFREILLTAPGNEKAISGVILFEETLYQKTSDGRRFVDILNSVGILVGIKVDKGLKPRTDSARETWTSGIEGLYERCKQYYDDGARFAKWRAALRIDVKEGLPTDGAVEENAETLSTYALEAQKAGLVPIVEPEILIDGDHSAEVSGEVAKRVIKACYEALNRKGVILEGSLLKPMMILPGLKHEGREKVGSEMVARMTLDVMKEVVPENVSGIMFLSGGMNEVEATRNLNALNRLAAVERVPWSVSFSYGRALQTSALELWAGDPGNVEKAKKVAAAVALANGRAQMGAFEEPHPSVLTCESLYENFRGWSGSQSETK